MEDNRAFLESNGWTQLESWQQIGDGFGYYCYRALYQHTSGERQSVRLTPWMACDTAINRKKPSFK